jgi:hypothetical protein
VRFVCSSSPVDGSMIISSWMSWTSTATALPYRPMLSRVRPSRRIPGEAIQGVLEAGRVRRQPAELGVGEHPRTRKGGDDEWARVAGQPRLLDPADHVRMGAVTDAQPLFSSPRVEVVIRSERAGSAEAVERAGRRSEHARRGGRLGARAPPGREPGWLRARRAGTGTGRPGIERPCREAIRAPRPCAGHSWTRLRKPPGRPSTRDRPRPRGTVGERIDAYGLEALAGQRLDGIALDLSASRGPDLRGDTRRGKPSRRRALRLRQRRRAR